MIVVDHHDSYTWNLVHLLARVTGVLPRVVQHDEVEPDDVLRHSHVVLSAGPGHPADPADFAVGEAVLRAGTRPVLGVCLGMQGLVTAYGGTVSRVSPAHGEIASRSPSRPRATTPSPRSPSPTTWSPRPGARTAW